MNFLLFLSLGTIVTADLTADISSATDTAGSLSSAISSWSSDDGVLGALPIQSLFQPMLNAVGAISSDAGGANPNDIGSFATLESSTIALLQALVEKADDFDSAGVTNIVDGAVSSIASAASGALTNVASAMSSQDLSGEEASSMGSIMSVFSAGFYTIGSVFDQNLPQFPTFQYNGQNNSSNQAQATTFASTSASSSDGVLDLNASSKKTSSSTSSSGQSNGGSKLTIAGGATFILAVYLM